MKVLGALVLAASLLLAGASPVSAVTLTDTQRARCHRLVGAVNAYRPVDLRAMRILCLVGSRRAVTMAHAGRLWHDLAPVMRALDAGGVCWTNVGEVIAWNNYGVGRTFVVQWRHSPPHWDILMARRYDRGGGGWTTYGDRHYAAFYVLDTC